MKKIPVAFPLILILILCVWLANQVVKKNHLLEDLKQECEASEIYIKSLRGQVNELQTEATSNTGSKINEFLQKGVSGKKYASDKDNVPDIIPIKGEFAISQKFKSLHQAMDIAVALGTEIIAPANGIITSVYEDKHFGKVIEIKHSEEFSTFYGHLAKILVSPDDVVSKGETIALAGNTGNSTAPHLHFEIKKNGKRMNYEIFLK
jgi:murein DD-endopeptidase MepM/ murein hydrolase activator NlpD